VLEYSLTEGLKEISELFRYPGGAGGVLNLRLVK